MSATKVICLAPWETHKVINGVKPIEAYIAAPITSFVVPHGWVLRGLSDHGAAVIQEEPKKFRSKLQRR